MTMKWVLGLVAPVALASAALVGAPASAKTGNGIFIITVHKELVGTPSADQVFDIHVECSQEGTNLVVSPSDTQSISWTAASDTFTPPDAKVVFSVGTSDLGSSEDVVCAVTESDSGDATTSSIVCGDVTETATCTSADDVRDTSDDSGTADLTVTNTYEAPTEPTTAPTTEPAPAQVAPLLAAAPVVAPANFTG
ncbi:MAG TPA: hypothetical protein VFW97_05540 [Acidimicrobiia bacterium]|jgi:hypothetical protein|nr:hypothetical protein [Acidimicrobiia bacterium]